jgi:O-antigen ligase
MLRVALVIIQIGAVAVVLVASPRTMFDLDRFLVPKELVLHLTALGAGLLTLRSMRRTRLDWLLLGFLLLSGLSAVPATNKWLALRALAISASGVVLFWAARALGEAGLQRQLINALAVAVVVAAITSLLQAYGLETLFFASTRIPGGTLGNRNFVAHMAAFGLPLCMLAAMRARRVVLASLGVTIVAAALVLSRSRAGWLAAAVALLIFCAFSVRTHGRRLLVVLAVGAAGAAAALLIPNALRWRSDNPYLESVTGVVDYERGSGRGRLVQYQRSLRMAAQHALLGVGPGNWAVDYPRHAARNDPSLNDSEAGTTFNPWPSSDWVAFVAERGFAAAVLLVLFFLALARKWDPTLLAVLAAAGIAGLFDAVLLLPAPALIAWTAFGALCSGRLKPAEIEAGQLKPAATLVLLLVLLGAARSAAQLTAMEIFATHGDRASLERASHIDPANYRLHLRLAHGGRSRCAHALSAHALYPAAEAAAGAARGCR